MTISYDTVSEAIGDLHSRGYTNDFNIRSGNEWLCFDSPPHQLPPEDFYIDEIYRFEGITDPGDEMIVYAISSKSQKVKGVIVNGFGTYSDGSTYEIVKRLKMKS